MDSLEVADAFASAVYVTRKIYRRPPQCVQKEGYVCLEALMELLSLHAKHPAGPLQPAGGNLGFESSRAICGINGKHETTKLEWRLSNDSTGITAM